MPESSCDNYHDDGRIYASSNELWTYYYWHSPVIVTHLEGAQMISTPLFSGNPYYELVCELAETGGSGDA